MPNNSYNASRDPKSVGMSHRWEALLLISLLAAPGVLAHGGIEDEDRYFANRPAADLPHETIVPEGYTGPGREPYLSYFEGVWLYGAVTSTPLGKQAPVDLDVDGDWVVWEDSNRSDIYAYNIPAGEGFYLVNDAIPQHHPRVSNNVVVYEEYRGFRSVIHAYFLDTGEVRRLSNSSSDVTEPDIDYPIVSWLDANITNPDVWAYSLLNHTGWNVHPGTDRDSDPVVAGEKVYWRTYRYNLWDVMGYDPETDELLQVTTDAAIQSAPFSDGENLLFLTNEYELGWRLERFDDRLGLSRRTGVTLPDSGAVSASGDAILRAVRDVDYSELVIRNLSNGASNHITGNLLLLGTPVLQGRTVFAPVRTTDGAALVMIDVSPFAFSKRPTLAISSPATNSIWVRPVTLSGILAAGSEFTEPTTFSYRIDDEAPQIIPPAKNWRATLDPAGLEPGRYIVTIRATFHEGPAVTASLALVVPAPSEEVDVARLGPAYHAGRILSEFQFYVVDNPASWVLIPVALIILAVAAIRLWLWFKPRRQRSVVEYVLPDDDADAS